MRYATYTIETERLLLRSPSVEDADAMFVWLSDPEVNRFMSYPLYSDVESVCVYLRSLPANEGDLDFNFVRKSDGLLIGAGGVYPKKDGNWVLGYNLRRDCWGKGYATEAMRAITRFAYRKMGAKVFTACHAVENPASGRVMEKCGLAFDHAGEYQKADGSRTFQARFYRMELA